MKIQKETSFILRILDELYPEAHCSLNFSTPLELLIATILSAQCTDARVNKVTKQLFQKYCTAEDYYRVSQEELEEDIRSTGFYKNKASNIKRCCKGLIDRFNGNVPRDLDALTSLPGIGRKTANVVLGTAFNIPGIVVDTHVKRISQRIGFTREKNPVKIEFDLMKYIPKSKWVTFSYQLINHGRSLCKARKPLCKKCSLKSYCDFFVNGIGARMR